MVKFKYNGRAETAHNQEQFEKFAVNFLSIVQQLKVPDI